MNCHAALVSVCAWVGVCTNNRIDVSQNTHRRMVTHDFTLSQLQCIPIPCDLHKRRMVTFSRCIPIPSRQADVHPSQPNTPAPTHREEPLALPNRQHTPTQAQTLIQEQHAVIHQQVTHVQGKRRHGSMTTALQRLTKHTSATHSMHKSTRLATLALHNSPTNVSIVANTVAVGLGPHNAHQPLLTNDLNQNAQTTYGHILTCIPIPSRQAACIPRSPTHRHRHTVKSPLPFQTDNIRPPRHKH